MNSLTSQYQELVRHVKNKLKSIVTVNCNKLFKICGMQIHSVRFSIEYAYLK